MNSFGSGKKVMLAFHGYGQDSTWFRHHKELFEKDYTIFSADLAFHGMHENFEEGLLFDSGYSEKWLSEILKQLGLKSIGLMGYSIGARIALSIAAWQPESISELWLMAPDGLPVSPMYKLLTNTFLGQFLFKSFIASPEFSLRLIRLLENVRLLHTKVADFYISEIGSIQKRQKLFDTWMAYRKAQPDYRRIKKQLRKEELKITCILGKQDRVIPYIRTRRFILKELSGAHIIELDLGHNLLSDKGARLLEQHLFNRHQTIPAHRD